jgi:hypothetical protein
MIKWLKNKMIWFMLAMQKTESNMKSKTGEDELLVGSGKYQSHKQGMLSHSLINGELTEEVKELRWRIYKILQHAQGVKTEIFGYDANDNPIVATKRSEIRPIKKYKSCPEDKLPIKMVVTNKKISLGTVDAMKRLSSESQDISLNDYLLKFKNTETTILIQRDERPMFEIEKYTKKMVVKAEDDSQDVLLEFYVSKYPDLEDRRSRLFLSEVKKIINGKHNSSLNDFNKVMFVSDNTLGVIDFLEFEFDIEKFHKITEYEGDYVIKFMAKKVVYGDDVLEKYKIESLETKYQNKERK